MRRFFSPALWLLGLALLLAIALPRCASQPPTTLPRRQQRQLRARLGASLQQAAAETLRAAQATRQGLAHYDSAQLIGRQAASLRQQTHHHVSPPPTTADTDARQLQRFFSTY